MDDLKLKADENFCKMSVTVTVETGQVLTLRVRAKWVLVDWGDGVWKENKPYTSKRTEVLRIHIIGQEIKLLNIERWGAEMLCLEHCPALRRLKCSGNRLKGLNLQDCPALTYVDCSSNQLEYVLVAQRKQLKEFKGNDNCLEVMDFSGCIQLRQIDLEDNPVFLLVTRHSKKLNVLKLAGSQFNVADYMTTTGNIPAVIMQQQEVLTLP